MKKLILLITFFLLLVSFLPIVVYALPQGSVCTKSSECDPDLTCQLNTSTNIYTCEPLSPEAGVFGKIVPPKAVEDLGIGSFGINNFINIIIRLIFILSSVIFVFMIITSAIQWLLSGGNKEAVAGAQKRLTYAIVGMIVLAIAFAIANLVGQFTGFNFF